MQINKHKKTNLNTTYIFAWIFTVLKATDLSMKPQTYSLEPGLGIVGECMLYWKKLLPKAVGLLTTIE